MLNNAQIWWEQIGGAAGLVRQLASNLMQMQSTILYIDSHFPWPYDFRLSVKDYVLHHHAEYRMETCDCAVAGDIPPGKWILDHVGGGREFYLPSEPLDELAISRGLTNQCIFWVENLQNKNQVRAWSRMAKLLRNAKSRGCVVLVADKRLKTPSALQTLYADKYFSTYDLSFFAATIASGLRLNTFEKRYLSELAVQLSCGRAERCAQLIEMEGLLLTQPEQAMPGNRSKALHRVWKAQMQTVFSSIEEEKYDLVTQNEELVRSLLGTTDDFGNQINGLSDIELRHLLYAQKHGMIALPDQVNGRIEALHSARNDLAHHKVLPYDVLVGIAENQT